MPEYDHGASSSETKSKILVVNASSAQICFIVGTAPIHLVDETNVNRLLRIQNEEEAVKLFGFDSDYQKYTLCEAIDVFFTKYKVGPVYMVQVGDPNKHFKPAAPETNSLINGKLILSQLGAIKSSVEVMVDGNLMELNTDYTLAYNDANKLVITALDTGSIKPTDTLEVTYNIFDTSMVTAEDVIGRVDVDGTLSGIKLVENVYPQFNEMIGSILAPRYSQDITVTNELVAHARNLSEQLIANAIVDLDTTKVKLYSDAVKVKTDSNLIDPHLNVCLGDVYIANKAYTLSTYVAATKQYIAKNNDNVPNQNPSNKSLFGVTGYKLNGKDLFLNKAQAKYLNANGIIVVRNISGWKIWGNRTACYPGGTDIKDFDIAVRDMGNWLLNNIVQFAEQFVDGQIDLPWLQRLEQSIQAFLDGLVGQNKLISGSFTAPVDKNPISDIANGTVRFVLKWATAATASSIIIEGEFVVEDLIKPLQDLQG